MCEKPLPILCTNIDKSKNSSPNSNCKGLLLKLNHEYKISELILSGKKCIKSNNSNNMHQQQQQQESDNHHKQQSQQQQQLQQQSTSDFKINHFDIKNKNFSIKFDECGKTRKEKIITNNKNFNSLPLFYYVSDLSQNGTAGAQPMMECPLRRPTVGQSYYHHHHYHHIPDQTKSLQELQNEVGALLEFRNLVIETFPDLKNKMASMSNSHTLTASNSGTNSPYTSRFEWEPGIRVKRKLVQLKDTSSASTYVESGQNDNTVVVTTGQNNVELSSSSLTRSRSNSHSGKKETKCSDNGGSGSVIIQDSGFSTETTSSKEAHSASSTTGVIQTATMPSRFAAGNELDDELLNLLDVIHRKSNKIRDEIENLQNHSGSKLSKKLKNISTTTPSSSSPSTSTSSNDQTSSTTTLDQFGNKSSTIIPSTTLKGCANQHKIFQDYIDKLNKEDIHLLRKERDELLNKLADIEAESLTDKLKLKKYQKDIEELEKLKREQEDNLKLVLNQKMELSYKLQELNKYHSGFSNNCSSQSFNINYRQSNTSTPLAAPSTGSRFTPTNDINSGGMQQLKGKLFSPLVLLDSDDNTSDNTQISKSFASGVNISKKSMTTFHNDIKSSIKYNTINLGHLDGFISEPNHLTKLRSIDLRKVSAILKETNVIELQRHLLTLTVQNQSLKQFLEREAKSKSDLSRSFEKSKEDLDDLRFQLEEKNIELQGTKAQLRVLESQSLKSDSGSCNQFKNTSFEEALNLAAIASTDLNDKTNLSSARTTNSSSTSGTVATEHHIFSMDIDVCRQISPPSMKAMIPIPMDDITNINNSSTESAHNENMLVASTVTQSLSKDISQQSFERQQREKPRPPSRIPLPGSKIPITSPKPPSGRMTSSITSRSSITSSMHNNNNNITTKYLCRSTGNLCGKSPTNLNRPNSAQSLRKESSLLNTSRSSTSSIPISNSSNSNPNSPSGAIGGGSGSNSSGGSNTNVGNQQLSSQQQQFVNSGKINPSQQQKPNSSNKSTNNSSSPVVKTKREHMSSARARNLDSLIRNQNQITSTYSSSTPGRSYSRTNSSNSSSSNYSKNNAEKNFFNNFNSNNSSSSNIRHNSNDLTTRYKKQQYDSSSNYNFPTSASSTVIAQSDQPAIKPKMNLTSNLRRMNTVTASLHSPKSRARNLLNNPITELQQQHLQLQNLQSHHSQHPHGDSRHHHMLLQQSNSQNSDVDNGKVRNLRSTVLGWLKF